jgi:hypothetical protein
MIVKLSAPADDRHTFSSHSTAWSGLSPTEREREFPEVTVTVGISRPADARRYYRHLRRLRTPRSCAGRRHCRVRITSAMRRSSSCSTSTARLEPVVADW